MREVEGFRPRFPSPPPDLILDIVLEKKNPQPKPWVQHQNLDCSYFATATCDFCSKRRACVIKSATSNGFTSDGIPFACR